jgi:hypothetical protein
MFVAPTALIALTTAVLQICAVTLVAIMPLSDTDESADIAEVGDGASPS